MPFSTADHRLDYLGIVEALYALELDEDNWLSTLARCACDELGLDHGGGYALTYDASDVNDCLFPKLVVTKEVAPDLERFLRNDVARLYQSNPAFVEAVFRRVPYGPSRDLPLGASKEVVHRQFANFGLKGILGLNGVNIDGRGVHIGVLVAGGDAVPGNDVLARLSTHLAAASRLRRRLDRSDPLSRADAIFRPDGAVEHAQGDAKLATSRRRLAEAVIQLEQARSATRKRDPEQALAQWKALVVGQWSLIDHFDRQGKKYILAERNDAEPLPVALLTRRERQVVSLAAMGHANKMIAYELGIAISTVGVLLGRAARKLSVSSRQALMDTYLAQDGGGQ